MNRKRKSGKELPHRVYANHGTYFYVPKVAIVDPRDPGAAPKAWIKLCRAEDGLAKLHTELGKVMGGPAHAEGTMPHCIQEFKAAKIKEPEYSAQTVKEYGVLLDLIAHSFEDFHATKPTTKHCADYIRKRYTGKPNTAKKVAGLLARLFRFIIGELGLRKDNPMDQYELPEKTKRREVLPTHDQIAAIRAAGFKAKVRKDTGHEAETLSGPTLACIIDMTYLLWQRAIDIRTLRDEKFEGVIRTTPSKTAKSSGKSGEFIITPAIQDVIDRARAIKRKHHCVSAYLFPALAGRKKGHPYSKSGLDSMWQRAKERAGLADSGIQFKDIRALGATDAARAGVSVEDIRKRLVHTTAKTSQVYIKEAIPEQSGINSALPWDKKDTPK